MARSVTFNGITRFTPGGITRVNADALNQVGTTVGVLALIGEADAGAPGSETGVIRINSPTRAKELFKSGPLVEAARVAFQSSADPRVPGGASEVLLYKVNASTKSKVQLPSEGVSIATDVATNTSTTTVVEVTAGGFSDDEFVGRWVDVGIASLPGSPVYRRRVVSNDASSITVTPALPVAPTTGDTVAVCATYIQLLSRDYGAGTVGIEADLVYDSADGTYQLVLHSGSVTETSPDLGGARYFGVTYLGGANAVAQDTVSGSTNTRTTITLTTGGLTPAAHAGATVVIRNTATGNEERSVISANTANELTLMVALSGEFLSEVNNASPGDVTVDILTVTDANAQFVGQAGRATAFTTTITGVTGDDLNISISQSMTLRELVDKINQSGTYAASAAPWVNLDTVLASSFDFGASTQTSIQASIEISPEGAFYRKVTELVEWCNSFSQLVQAERFSEQGDDGAAVPTAVNDGDPVDGDYPYVLTGGERGISANSDWQAAFDAFLQQPTVRQIVPLIDQNLAEEGNGSTATVGSVAFQLLDHVAQARGSSFAERGAVLGIRGTKDQFTEIAASLNDADIQLVSQSPTIVNSAGTLQAFGPSIYAVMAASMRLGMPEIGEPLTFKYVRVASVTQDPSWDPMDPTDRTDLIKAGCLFTESIPGKGTRWVRDLTTWVRDDNLAYSEGSVRDVVRYVAKDLREFIEDRFTGIKAKPATIASVKDAAVTRLEQYRSEGVIVDSTDPATDTVIRAYHNLKVFSSGDVTRLNVGIFPVVGINFQLTDIYLQLPTQSA